MTTCDNPSPDLDSITKIDQTEGGITAPTGFKAAGVACGIKPSGLDLALIISKDLASAVGVFTTSLAAAAPVILSRNHLEQSAGHARGIVINSGCANACTGTAGIKTAKIMAEAVARAISCPVEEVLVASTGVIGVMLDSTTVTTGIATAAKTESSAGHADAARAIMTTDPWPKESAARVQTPEGTFTIGGMAKGSGMIEPMLATMLAFLTTDAKVSPSLLGRALKEAVDQTFNTITVDGECSTNDSVMALANGHSNIKIDKQNYSALVNGLRTVCHELALGIVRGGEGATKLIKILVTGATTKTGAQQTARAIANSPLVKTAIHGGDPNWGRLIAVAGRSGSPMDLEHASVKIGSVVLFSNGNPHDERTKDAARQLQGQTVELEVNVGAGGCEEAIMWTCDLTADYVKINSEYRT